jgi:hypothetical protein
MLCRVLLLYDKLSSLRPSNMSNPSVKHVRYIRFDSIRHETCMILYSNLLTHLGTQPIVACTQPVVACTQPVVASTDTEFIAFIDLV